jgi:hypothetical protein
MTSARFERIPTLCADLDASIQLAKDNHATVRALLLIELARNDLRRSIDAIQERSTVVELL